ncbi:tRNA lysidine(34) synthetase TilS [Dellaglioa sp. BT-FLS60]
MLNTKFEAQYRLIGGPKKVLVAASTGVDSMVLLDLLQQLPRDIRPEIGVAYVDHQLREQSQVETEFIEKYCHENKLKLYQKVWPVAEHGLKGIENAAREMRYLFFEQTMLSENYGLLMTAHHANDQIETLVMKSIRGGDIEQLTGIDRMRSFGPGQLVRPLLVFSKQEIRDYAQKQKVTFFEDETNQSTDFFRNRVRKEIIPRMLENNNQALEHAQSYVDQLSNLLDLADEAIGDKMALIKNESGFLIAKWQALPIKWRKPVLKKMAEEQGGFLKTEQIRQIDQLLMNRKKPQSEIDLGNNQLFSKKYEYMAFVQKEKPVEINSDKMTLRMNAWINLNENEKIGVFEQGKINLEDTDIIDYILVNHSISGKGLSLRHRLPGDYITIENGGKQKIKKIFIDQKIGRDDRNKAWVLETNAKQIVWLINYKKSQLSDTVETDKIQDIIVLKNQRQERG